MQQRGRGVRRKDALGYECVGSEKTNLFGRKLNLPTEKPDLI
jgi:hypothetical protein